MRSALIGFCWFTLVSDACAHRLDEYLQATRIAVTTNRVEFTFDLTPGVTVAGQILKLIDRNGNGQLADDEGTAYGRQFLKDHIIELDGKIVAPGLTTVSLPSVREIRSGVGVIRIKAMVSLDPLGVGGHILRLTNGHLPAISVYLVNALRPANTAVAISKQTRDQHQKNYSLAFSVKPAGP